MPPSRYTAAPLLYKPNPERNRTFYIRANSLPYLLVYLWDGHFWKKKCTHSRLWCSYSKIILQRQPTWTIQIHHPTLFLSETASSFAVIVDYINDKECESNSNISITYLPHQALGRLQWIITEWFINEVERGIRRKDAKHTHTN